MVNRVCKRPIQIAYRIAWIWIGMAALHFFNIDDFHELLLLVSILPVIACTILGLQTQPREMQPALFAFLGIWIHVACMVLSEHFGWVIQ